MRAGIVLGMLKKKKKGFSVHSVKYIPASNAQYWHAQAYVYYYTFSFCPTISF